MNYEHVEINIKESELVLIYEPYKMSPFLMEVHEWTINNDVCVVNGHSSRHQYFVRLLYAMFSIFSIYIGF